MEPIALITTQLVKVKETKNMVRYDAPGNEEQQMRSNVPNIYVRKTALAAAFSCFPETIKITIETE